MSSVDSVISTTKRRLVAHRDSTVFFRSPQIFCHVTNISIRIKSLENRKSIHNICLILKPIGIQLLFFCLFVFCCCFFFVVFFWGWGRLFCLIVFFFLFASNLVWCYLTIRCQFAFTILSQWSFSFEALLQSSTF